MIKCNKDLQDLALKGLLSLGFTREEIKKELELLSKNKAKELLQTIDDNKLEKIFDNLPLQEKKGINFVSAVLLSILAVGSLASTSCSNPFVFNFQGYEINHEDLLESWKEVASYPYLAKTQVWPSPEQFKARNGGMCGGFSGMLLYLVGPGYKLGVIESNIVWPNRNVEGYHAIVGTPDGRWLEPQWKGKFYTHISDSDFKKIYTYEEAMRMITWLGMKDISSEEQQKVDQMRNELFSFEMTDIPAPGKE
jgi:hypothetical protein